MTNHPSVLYYTESGPMTSTESSMHMTFHFATSWASRKLKFGGFFISVQKLYLLYQQPNTWLKTCNFEQAWQGQ